MTKAMRMVAASRLKKARHLVEISGPYAQKIEELASHLASNIMARGVATEKFPLLVGNAKSNSYLLIVVSSDRGLCGGINSAAVKFAKSRIQALLAADKTLKILCIGKKAYEQLRLVYPNNMLPPILGLFRNKIEYETALSIADKLVADFKSSEFDICEVVFNKFKSVMVQKPSLDQLIPVPISQTPSGAASRNKEGTVKYEPSEEELLERILPKNLAMQIYNRLLENNASEQGARMAAMEAASNNASKMIKGLTLVYNRNRQANITRELIDIISGANAV